MCKYWLIAGTVMLAMAGDPALAQDIREPSSKKAEKVIRVLGAIGMSDSRVNSLVREIDNRVKDGYLTFGEERMAGGTLRFQYELSSKVHIRQLELRFTPDDSNWVATARPDGLMVTYSYKF